MLIRDLPPLATGHRRLERPLDPRVATARAGDLLADPAGRAGPGHLRSPPHQRPTQRRDAARRGPRALSVRDGGTAVTALQQELLGAALTAADRGWHAFALRPGDKRPAIRDWQERATADHRRSRAAWARDAWNLGIACGPSGLVVVDLDVPKPGNGQRAGWAGKLLRNGQDVLGALADRVGEHYPSATYSVATGSGGTHLYFRAPEGERLRNTAGRVGWLIDTRADGRYVVGGGSVIDGQRYRVRTSWKVADFPQWLAALCTSEVPDIRSGTSSLADIPHQSAYATAALRAEVERVVAAEPGTRNHTLNAAAYSLGQLVGAGVLSSKSPRPR